MTEQITNVSSELGDLLINTVDGKLVSLKIGGHQVNKKPNKCEASETIPVEIRKYFSNPKHTPKFEVDPAGTDFQKRVWQALREIPAGSVETYGSLAKKLGSSPRAVGNACRTNPIPVVIPCHRVVAANGLGGFMGQTEGDKMRIKKWLLKHEGVLV